jgi:hypothetical protein
VFPPEFKTMSKLKSLSCFCVAVFVSCAEPEDMNQVDKFNIAGKRTFESDSGTGQIFGVSQNDKDDNPAGYIDFFTMDLVSQILVLNY